MTRNIAVRRFGLTDLMVSEIGLGCARIGGIFQSDPAGFVRLLSAAHDAGINFFDTADIYSQGESERLLGRALRQRRNQIVIASKAGYILPAQRRFIARLKPFVRPLIELTGFKRRHLPGAVRGSLAQDFSPSHLRRAVEGSLRRLGTDRLDLFQLHSPPASTVDEAGWLEELERLRADGKIRYYGVSCDTVEAASVALGRPGISSIQVPINLLDRRFVDLPPRASRQGCGVIARECLANGLLVKDAAAIDLAAHCQTAEEGLAKAAELDAYRDAAKQSGKPLAAFALDYVRRLSGVSVSLVGVSRLEQLESLLATAIT